MDRVRPTFAFAASLRSGVSIPRVIAAPTWRLLLLSALPIVFSSGLALAKTGDPMGALGLADGGSFVVGGKDDVNVLNGNLNQ